MCTHLVIIESGGVLLIRDTVGVKDLNPIAVWVLDESQSLHAAVIGLLDKINAKFLEAVREKLVEV